MQITHLNILLVEDNEGDVLLTTEALNESHVAHVVTVVRDGWAAIQYLNGISSNNPTYLPDIILLDINLPKMNGHEVLKNIKSDEKLKHIPVIILTTSSLQSDIHRSYQNHANCYISKPVEADEFIRVVLSIENFWANSVQLPSKIRH